MNLFFFIEATRLPLVQVYFLERCSFKGGKNTLICCRDLCLAFLGGRPVNVLFCRGRRGGRGEGRMRRPLWSLNVLRLQQLRRNNFDDVRGAVAQSHLLLTESLFFEITTTCCTFLSFFFLTGGSSSGGEGRREGGGGGVGGKCSGCTAALPLRVSSAAY